MSNNCLYVQLTMRLLWPISYPALLYICIAVLDRMFGDASFWFLPQPNQSLPNFIQTLPDYPNLTQISQIFSKFAQILSRFAEISPKSA